MSKRAKAIPKFSGEAAERAFWEKNDSTQYLDWSKAQVTAFPGPAPFPWTVFCLRCWVIFVFICLLLGSYNAGRSGAAGVRSAGFFLGDLACP
jgi:hypothetical protein